MPTLKLAVVPVTPFQQNCSIVWCEATKKAVVVDPGGDVPRIVEAIGKLEVDVEKIWLTHAHIDHAGGVAGLKRALEAKSPGRSIALEGPDRRDQFLIADLEASGRKFGMTGVETFVPDRWLAEGETVTIGKLVFELLHCPGHTPGSLVYVNRENHFALVGDVLFKGSVGRTDFAYGDSEALIRSITGKLLPLGDDMMFLCGHGPPSTIGEERESNPFLR